MEAELLKYGGTRNMMSLGDENTVKYHIWYCHDDSTLCIDSRYYIADHGAIHFKSKEGVQNAIDKIGEERIKKYLFYVD